MKGSQVRVENLDKNFGLLNVLKNVNLGIREGEFFSLLGPSGCGKTTLLRLIAGFEDPTQGIIYIDGNNVTDTPPNLRHVNTVFQNYALFPHLTVFENIAFGPRLKKFSNQEITIMVNEYLDLVRLTDQAYKFPAQLSGGQKQRVAIARALINKPQVLLLDEPLSALDAKLRHQLLIELDLIHDKVGITFIYVTHDQQEALGVSDRIAIMNQGKILQVGSSKEIYEKPADEFVATFIGETNLLNGFIKEKNHESTNIQIHNLGELTAPISHKPLKTPVQISIRPERVEISKTPPKNQDISTILEGTIEEIVYFGFQSKFFVKVGDQTLHVFKQHHLYDESRLTYNDKVYLWWDINDCYLI